MQFPLIEIHVISNLRLAHGIYNACVALLFFYQAWLGLKIRSARKAKAPLPFPFIKRHRKMGPVLTVLGVFGFFIGFALILVHTGRILKFPSHLFIGLALIVLLAAIYALSRKIKGPDSPHRTPHMLLGITILCLYIVEVFLGIGILF
jgi:hypothetical protein